jgi:hypothetical protein
MGFCRYARGTPDKGMGRRVATRSCPHSMVSAAPLNLSLPGRVDYPFNVQDVVVVAAA